MAFSSRCSILALVSAAFFSAAAIGSAEASQWFWLQTPAVNVDPPATGKFSPVQLAATALKYRDGSYTGPAYDAYFGIVQVRANIQNGQLVSVDVLEYPNHQRTSRSINRQALPMLQSEVISAQAARVHIISGATLTSKAYLRSLYGALSKSGS